MITLVKGDLLKSKCNIICHQVNCQGKMGAGIAKQIRQLYPKVYTEYIDFCNKNKKHLLGDCQFVDVSSDIFQCIANLFGQEYYGCGALYTDYDALRSSFNKVKDFCNHLLQYRNDISVGIPYNIGCGLAGGDWNIVIKIIEDIFKDEEHIHIEIYKL